MAVITISRQMGCLGREISEEVARRLNYRRVWREVINEAAIRAGVPEVALATIDELDLLGLRPPVSARKAYHDAVREIMRELAVEGNVVIVGRAGQAILHGMEGVLHIRLYAPFSVRVERVAKRQNITLETARAQVQASDQARMRYLKRYYQVRWDDPELYDLMINTKNLTVEMASAAICELAARRETLHNQ